MSVNNLILRLSAANKINFYLSGLGEILMLIKRWHEISKTTVKMTGINIVSV